MDGRNIWATILTAVAALTIFYFYLVDSILHAMTILRLCRTRHYRDWTYTYTTGHTILYYVYATF